jgi:hypothetical protein
LTVGRFRRIYGEIALLVKVLVLVVVALPASASPAPRLVLPYDVELDPSGRIVIADGGKHQLVRWDAERKRLVVFKTGVGEATCLAFDRRGNLYVSDVAGGLVRRIDASGRMSTVLRLEAAAGVSLDPAGRHLAVASIVRGVVRVELASGVVETIAAVGEGELKGPHGVAYAANGDLWIADPGSGVHRLRAGGRLERATAYPAYRVVPLRGGGAYLVSGTPSGGRVVRLRPDGSLTRVAGTGRLSRHADGIRATRAGILPSDVAPMTEGRLLLTQTQAVAALRVIDRAGTIRTIVR